MNFIKAANGGKSWSEWEELLKKREKTALEKVKEELEDEIGFYQFQQYEFDRQWKKLHTYAKEQGIQIIGDIPIYVAFDSADVWAAPELFQFDEENNPIRVAGCPPDAFAKTGQLWGNPLYNWEYHQKTGYAWWIQRIRYCFQRYDVVRIDHFRGFDEYYAIPYGESTAENGTWMPGPGMKLFQAIEKELGRPEIIAEDLGFLTESVLQMLKESGFPGMKVLQFAFDPSGESVYLPHRYSENCVVYTGTHDNDTTRGWYRTLDKESRDFAKEYMGVSRLDDDTLTWDFMRLAMGSAAQLCVTPIQDILGIDGSGRINMPSTLGGNWTWQMEKGAFDKKIVHKLYRMTQLYGRLNEQIKKQPEPGMENLKCKEKRVGKNKKLRKVLSVFFCFFMVFSMLDLSAVNVKADTVAESTMNLNRTITVDGNELELNAQIRFNAVDEDTNTVFDESKTYTRGEWVTLLLDKLNAPLMSADQIDYYYLDSLNSATGTAVETANAYGFLPVPDVEDLEQDIPLFYPDEPCTREFAAYTAVHAMGFNGENTIAMDDWSDANQVKYKDEIKIALVNNFLYLTDNTFYPQKTITGADVKSIFYAIDDLNESIKLSKDQTYDHSEILDSVVNVAADQAADYSVVKNGDVYEVTLPNKKTTDGIKVDDVIRLPESTEYATGLMLKVAQISQSGDSVKLVCTVPELAEIYSKLDLAELGLPAVDSFVAAEGVTCEYNSNGSITADDSGLYPLSINAGGSTEVPGTLKFTIAKKKITEDLKVSGSVEVKIPDITCIAKANVGWGGVDVDEFTLSISEKIKIASQLELTLAQSGYELTNSNGATRFESGRIEIGRLPIRIGATGLSFDIVFFCNVSAKGTASITYTINSTQGYQYKNGASRGIFDFYDSLDFMEIKAFGKMQTDSATGVFTLFR